MTSGEFRSVSIDSITIGERQRSELPKIPELAESIGRLGLLSPILVDHNLELVHGHRRWTACKSLGWTHISVQFTEEGVDEFTRWSMEWDENFKREDLPWEDQCREMIRHFERWKAAVRGFTQADFAASCGLSQQYVSKVLFTAEEARRPNNGRILAADNLATAHRIAVRAVDRREAEVREQLRRKLNPKAEVESGPILNVDFNEWVKTYDGDKFNFIHCDFPYGIGADGFNQGSAEIYGGYEDTPEAHERLCESLRDNLERLCEEQCHFMFWFSLGGLSAVQKLPRYQWTLDFFDKHIKFDPFPLVWMKNGNKGIMPDGQRGPRRIYETAFFGSRGDRLITVAGPVNNAIAADPDKRPIHMSPKPVPVLQHFFQMFVDEHTRMLDPTAGSGNALIAAEDLGAPHVLGLESEEKFCKDANRAVSDAREKRKPK
jgi:ParB family chromosome partitioning protein